MFQTLEARPADALLGLIRLFAQDTRSFKIDLGVGVYKDPGGRTPVFAAVKAAEQRLVEMQETKAYLGPEGDLGYLELLGALVFGTAWKEGSSRFASIQTPGGTGALRIGADLLHEVLPRRRIWLGLPTWPNHAPIFRAAGLEIATYPYFDVATQTVQFDALLAALDQAEPGDAILLHGCCHNPTGADLSPEQWEQVADVIEQRGLLPFVDLAYHGLGDGLEADLYGVRLLSRRAPGVVVAVSCSKNFGLYRDRIGALYVLTADRATAAIATSHMAGHARTSWSMPPDHGAAVVRLILEDDILSRQWRDELDAIQRRVSGIRAELAKYGAESGAESGGRNGAENNRAGPVDLTAVGQQKGMFSTLPLTREQVLQLRTDRAVYMADSGRINVAGLQLEQVPAFVEALRSLG